MREIIFSSYNKLSEGFFFKSTRPFSSQNPTTVDSLVFKLLSFNKRRVSNMNSEKPLLIPFFVVCFALLKSKGTAHLPGINKASIFRLKNSGLTRFLVKYWVLQWLNGLKPYMSLWSDCVTDKLKKEKNGAQRNHFVSNYNQEPYNVAQAAHYFFFLYQDPYLHFRLHFLWNSKIYQSWEDRNNEGKTF